MSEIAMADTKKKINVLFLGGAKRVSFGRKLIEVGKRLGTEIEIYSYELEAEVPVAVIGGIVIGRRWSAPDILEHLHHVVEAYHIDVLLPFVDGAISIAGAYVATYGDAWSPVVKPGLAETLFDKVLSARAFENAGLDVPATYRGGKPQFPLIAKPRRGSASKGIEVIEGITDFRRIQKVADDYLLQTYYPNKEEYTVDCYVARDGSVICAVPRERLEVMGGEVTRTATCRNADLESLARQVLDSFTFRGPVTLQFLRDKSDGRFLLMEVNPRLGGGVICSVAAGADIPGFIIQEALGIKPAKCEDWKAGILMARYWEEVIFNLNDNAGE